MKNDSDLYQNYVTKQRKMVAIKLDDCVKTQYELGVIKATFPKESR